MAPSSFVIQWAARLAPTLPAPRRALDVAMGSGRHALPLAAAGYDVFGVDRDGAAVHAAVRAARAEGLTIRAWCADLTEHPLPVARFALVVVTRYLQRALFGALGDALVPGGVLVYETFTVDRLAAGLAPRSPDHLLRHGELPALVDGFDVLAYEELRAPEALARIAARKPLVLRQAQDGRRAISRS